LLQAHSDIIKKTRWLHNVALRYTNSVRLELLDAEIAGSIHTLLKCH